MNSALARIAWKSNVSACLVIGTLLLSPAAALAQNPPKNQRVPQNFNVLPITITEVFVQNGQLFAQGLVGTNPFPQPVAVNLAAQPGGNGAACPILDLSLGPIDLNLLGLRVQTSEICLQITAYEGGGLLGDLLCSVANLLQGGTPLATVLAGLTPGELDRLLNGITQLLNGALDAATANTVARQPGGAIAASCTVLDLSLGPIELTLLGLEVILDDCDGGPVTVTITAIPGGGLLGDLLCSLSNVLSGRNPSQTAVQALLWQITRVLGGLLG